MMRALAINGSPRSVATLHWNFGVGCLKGEALNDEEGLRNMNHLGQVVDWLGKAIASNNTTFSYISIKLH